MNGKNGFIYDTWGNKENTRHSSSDDESSLGIGAAVRTTKCSVTPHKLRDSQG